MTGNRYFAEAMKGYGVTHLFYVNTIVPPAMLEMDKVGVTRVITHGETIRSIAESAKFDGSVNLAKVADSMGCVGFRVEKPADIRQALDEALASGRPALVEVLGNPAIRAKRGWVPPAISGE